jgi:hypothetical protein
VYWLKMDLEQDEYDLLKKVVSEKRNRLLLQIQNPTFEPISEISVRDFLLLGRLEVKIELSYQRAGGK